MSTPTIHRRKHGPHGRIRYGKRAGGFVTDCGRDLPANTRQIGTGLEVTCETCIAFMRARMGGDCP